MKKTPSARLFFFPISSRVLERFQIQAAVDQAEKRSTSLQFASLFLKIIRKKKILLCSLCTALEA